MAADGSAGDRQLIAAAEVRLHEDADGVVVVLHGWAVAYRRYRLDYVGDKQKARDAGAGLWAGTFIDPETWRRGSGESETVESAPAPHRHIHSILG